MVYMKKSFTLWLLIILLAFLFVNCENNEMKKKNLKEQNHQTQSAENTKPKQIPATEKVEFKSGYKVSEPYTHKNLSIFLIHGQDQIKNKNFLTLEEALKQKKVRLYETGEVERLELENLTKNTDIYVLAGDIVKGGKQDRVVQHDLVLSPKSGKVNVSSFCVEQGRWQRRGSESLANFKTSRNSISSQALKLSVRKYKTQKQVWDNVKLSQQRIRSKTGLGAVEVESTTSMDLTLENKKLKKESKEYFDKLQSITENKQDIIGYAFAINGEIRSADVYAGNQLFIKLWPKLLKSSVVEAVAEYDENIEFKSATMDDVKQIIDDTEKAPQISEHDINKRIRLLEKESEKNILFETLDKSNSNQWFRKNYLVKIEKNLKKKKQEVKEENLNQRREGITEVTEKELELLDRIPVQKAEKSLKRK